MYITNPQQTGSMGVTADELIDAANEASAQSRNMWIAFIALLAYLILTIGGTTHRDLLLNNPVTLPFLQVDIPLFSFFIYGPLVVLAIHLGLLVQHAMLAFKLFRVTEILNDGGWHRPGQDPRRSKLHAYIFAQLIAGPVRTPLMTFLMGLMTWISLVALPVFTLLLFQVAFLPFHDEVATNWHRIAVLLDVLIIFALAPYMRAATKRESKAKARSGVVEVGWPWRVTALGFGIGSLATIGLLLFSWFIATIPDGCLYRNKSKNFEFLCFDNMMAKLKPFTVEIKSGNTKRDVFFLTAWLFEGEVDTVTGKPTSIWSRNIVLTDVDLVPDKEFGEGEVSVSLRGRDLRYAVLDRSDLHRADFTAVDLRGASLKETRLENARFCVELRTFPRNCSEFKGADLKDANLKGVDFWGAKLDNAELSFVRLEGADFRNAYLQGANLSFAKLRGANLGLADLKGAKFSYASLPLANFSEAELTEAEFSGANLQGADLRKAQLEGANLTAANLQGAQLSSAKLQGANLRDAKLEGVDLRMSDLRGTNLERASLKGTDMRFVRLWGSKPPGEQKEIKLIRMAGISFRELNEEELEELQDTIEAIEDESLRKRLQEKLAKVGLLAKNPAKKEWDAKSDWEAALKNLTDPEAPKMEVSVFEDFWAELACRHVDIAQSIANRLASDDYFSDRRNLAQKLTSRACDATIALKKKTKLELCHLARWQVEDRKNTICQ